MSEGQAKATRRPRPSSYSVMNADATPARRLSSHRTKGAAEREAESLRARGYTTTVEPFFPTEAPALPSALDPSEAWMAERAHKINVRLFRASSARGMQLVISSREGWAKDPDMGAAYLELSRAETRARRSAAWSMALYFHEAEAWKGRATLT